MCCMCALKLACCAEGREVYGLRNKWNVVVESVMIVRAVHFGAGMLCGRSRSLWYSE